MITYSIAMLIDVLQATTQPNHFNEGNMSTASRRAIVKYWSEVKPNANIAVDWSEAHDRCWRCGKNCNIRLHRCHVVPDQAPFNGPDIPSNLVLLCAHCHDESPCCDDPQAMWDYIAEGDLADMLRLAKRIEEVWETKGGTKELQEEINHLMACAGLHGQEVAQLEELRWPAANGRVGHLLTVESLAAYEKRYGKVSEELKLAFECADVMATVTNRVGMHTSSTRGSSYTEATKLWMAGSLYDAFKEFIASRRPPQPPQG
jgi:hypothetical protein